MFLWPEKRCPPPSNNLPEPQLVWRGQENLFQLIKVWFKHPKEDGNPVPRLCAKLEPSKNQLICWFQDYHLHDSSKNWLKNCQDRAAALDFKVELWWLFKKPLKPILSNFSKIVYFVPFTHEELPWCLEIWIWPDVFGEKPRDIFYYFIIIFVTSQEAAKIWNYYYNNFQICVCSWPKFFVWNLKEMPYYHMTEQNKEKIFFIMWCLSYK